jgi:hypothetical protein
MTAAYLERLGVPILDLAYRRHVIEALGKMAQVLHAMRQADGKLLGEKQRGAEQGCWGAIRPLFTGDRQRALTGRWPLAKLHHLPQTDAGRRLDGGGSGHAEAIGGAVTHKVGIVGDHVHQLIGLSPGHGDGCLWGRGKGSWRSTGGWDVLRRRVACWGLRLEAEERVGVQRCRSGGRRPPAASEERGSRAGRGGGRARGEGGEADELARTGERRRRGSSGVGCGHWPLISDTL